MQLRCLAGRSSDGSRSISKCWHVWLLVEFIRGNEVVWEGLTRPQLFLALTIPLLLARLVAGHRRGHYEPLWGRSSNERSTREEVQV